MPRAHLTTACAALLLMVGLPLLLVGCSADSPSEPEGNPGPPPGSSGSTTYNITVQVTPNELPTGSDDPARIDIAVRRTATGQPPANGTTAVVSVSTGSLGSDGSGIQSVPVELLNGNASVQLYPPDAGVTEATTIQIQARLENSIGQAQLRLSEGEVFHVSYLEPASGSPTGGDVVTVVGSGFERPVRVTFDGVAAQIQSVSSNRIRLLTPPSRNNVPVGETSSVAVMVISALNTEDQQSDSLDAGFTYVRGGGGGGSVQPLVYSLTPASGPNEGGTRVTIRGEGFQEPVQVFFGSGTTAGNFSGVEAEVESVTSDRIVVVTPPATAFGQDNLNETVNVLVRNLSNGFSTVATSAFQYGSDVLVTSISPGEGIFLGGDLVTIFGQGFDEPVAVEMGGVGQNVISVTGTEIVVRTVGIDVDSCADESGVTQVVNIESGDSATGPVFVYRVPEPVITSVSPSSGSQNGGTQVAIGGLNFYPPVRVSFDVGGETLTASVVSVEDGGPGAEDVITIRTPSVPNSVFDTEACDDNGDGTLGERYIPTAADIRLVSLLTDCEDEFLGGFIYTPSNQSCRNDVAPDDGEGDGGDGGGVSPPG